MKYDWLSIEAYFHDVAGSVSLLSLTLNVATISILDVWKQLRVRLPRSNAKTIWHSIDVHFQDGAGRVSVLVLTWKAANTSFMNGCDQSPPMLHKLHSYKLLTLCWCLFSEWGSDTVITVLPAKPASMFVMNSRYQVTFQLPYLWD
jgi:hypothetical protein